MTALVRSFFARPTLTVARDLIGKKLVRRRGEILLSGMITETEAYGGPSDSASHAFRGRTPRNAVMFGPPGTAYVYLVYGRHFMLNIVTEEEGVPGAVLLRAIRPVEGVEEMERLRGMRGKRLTDGPGKICRALAIEGGLNGKDLTQMEELWLEAYLTVPTGFISAGPRVGIDYATVEDSHACRRFTVQKNFLEGF